MYRMILPLLLLLLATCAADPAALEREISAIKADFAPDRRTDRVEVTVKNGQLQGYVTHPDAAARLREAAATYPELKMAVRVLPDTAVGVQTAGLVNVSVANLRSKPGHSQELATQALLGTPLEVLDLRDGWYLVRTPDRYLAWLEPGAFVRMSPQEALAWLDSDLRRYGKTSGLLTVSPGGSRIVSDLVAGNLLQSTGRAENSQVEVRLPDGTSGWVPAADLTDYRGWQRPPGLDPDQLLATAATLAGRPYFWGGTSPKGMDCSGFTKTAFYLNGYVIPRDASQQVHAGTPVELTDDLANLQRGDLLFFGRYREDGSERITHVGFYLGAGRFLHSGADNGRIAENSLLPGDVLFAEHRRKSLLRVQRLGGGTEGVLPVEQAFGALLE
ncbi:MAG: C40 family peptidase [Bacteroidota bacterium]